MKTYLPFLVSGLLLARALTAQDAITPSDTPGASLLAAAQTRATLANEVQDDRESAARALETLRATKNPSELETTAEAGWGFAAVDIGHRLLAAGKPTAAEVFFEEAESALSQAVAQTSDDHSREKAQYLQTLAQVRGNYLGKEKEAGENMAAAARLQPDDERLQRLSENYAARLKAREGLASRVRELWEVAQ